MERERERGKGKHVQRDQCNDRDRYFEQSRKKYQKEVGYQSKDRFLKARRVSI